MPTTLSLRTSSPSLARRPVTRAVVRVTPRIPAAHRPAPSLWQDLNRALLVAVETLETWSARRAQRRALQALPDQLLQDIGRSRAEAEAEADKPFWMA